MLFNSYLEQLSIINLTAKSVWSPKISGKKPLFYAEMDGTFDRLEHRCQEWYPCFTIISIENAMRN